MSMKKSAPLGLVFGLLLFVAAVVSIAYTLQHPTQGPVEPVWDREACAHCKMHIGEPTFAAQLQTKDHHIFHFDDPGCLLKDLAIRNKDIAALYFRDSLSERWLSREEVAFVKVSSSPMGYNLAAVPLGTPGAVDMTDAINSIRSSQGGTHR